MELYINVKKRLQNFHLDVCFNTSHNVSGIMGKSGSGKSLTLRLIAGIDTPDWGQIVINNKIFFDADKKINIPANKRNIGYLFQNYALFPNMTVEENISFALKSKGPNSIIIDTVSMLKLNGLEKHYPHQLSGGQQQRVALARALAIKPDILLLDEPFSAIDENLHNNLLEQLQEILHYYNGIAILVTHNKNEIFNTCKNLILYDHGKILSAGKTYDIFTRPPNIKTAQMFGCTNFSKVKYIATNKVFAIDWGIELYVNQELAKNSSYIGIYSNNVALIDGNKNIAEFNNIFNCQVQIKYETFSRVVFNATIKTNTTPIEGKVDRANFNTLNKISSEIKLYLNPDYLMFFPYS